MLPSLNTPLSALFHRTGRPGSVRVRLTASGWGFLVLLLCGFLMSVNYSNNLVFAMTFLLFGIALVGYWQTRLNVSGLSIAGMRCEAVFAGQQVLYRMVVHNPSERVRVGLSVGPPAAGGTGEAGIPPRARVEMEIRRTAPARGVLEPAPAGLSSRFPLGLFLGTAEAGKLPTCMVYPAPRGTQALPSQAGGQHAHRHRESGAFTDMRRYAPGDPPSRIAWQALARTGEVYVKEFDGAEGQPALWLNWEAVRAGGVEDKLSQICRWVLDAHDQGREYGLALPGLRIQPGSDEAHRRRCLKALAMFEHGGGDAAGAPAP